MPVELTEEAEARDRRKPTKPPRKRRNFARELTELQGRVDMAVRLMRKIDAEQPLVAVALETLEGK